MTVEDLIKIGFNNFVADPTDANFKQVVALMYCGMQDLPMTELSRIVVNVGIKDSYFGAP